MSILIYRDTPNFQDGVVYLIFIIYNLCQITAISMTISSYSDNISVTFHFVLFRDVMNMNPKNS